MNSGGGLPLPYDAEVEYLKNSGTQWIDTGYIPDSLTLEFEFAFKVTAVNSSAGSIFGSRSYVGNVHHDIIQILTYQSGTRRYRFDYNTTATNLQQYDTNKHVFKYSNGVLTLDGNTLVTYTPATFTTQKIFLFATNQDGSVTLIHPGISIYYFKFGALDLIPVRKGQVGYMYDRVSGTLFGNSGTGDFILGNDKN